MRFNPLAILFWAFCGLVGYLVNGTHGAIVGLTIGTGLSLLLAMF